MSKRETREARGGADTPVQDELFGQVKADRRIRQARCTRKVTRENFDRSRLLTAKCEQEKREFYSTYDEDDF